MSPPNDRHLVAAVVHGERRGVALATIVVLSTLVLGLPVANAGTTQNLQVTLNGTGTGTVTSSPAGIDCAPTCTFDFNAGDPVSLSANPDPSSVFDHWGGDCSGTGSCDLTMDVDHAVTAVFTLKTHTLTVSTSGTGSGTVTSSPGGISCGSNCTQDYDHGTVVDLTPTPDPTSTFDHWLGDCTGTGACSVTMNSDQAVDAVFALKIHTLTVTTNGTGTGTVTSSPGGISCPSNCTQDYNHGTDVDLTPTPDPSSTFAHWSGDCSGSGACTVTMNGDASVNAVFTLKARTLDVTDGGTGTGTVTSSPGGINCGSNCTQDYDNGTVVDLTPTADPSSTFAHWSGDCSGSGACSVTMNGDRAVTAVFTLKTHTLTVSAGGGTGTGTVTSSPGGINCGSNCTQDYDHGTVVSLTPAADLSSTFSHWSGDCSGSGACSVTMTADRNVTAVFTLKLRSLDVTKNGTGSGTVTSAPGGINCGATCSHNYAQGTSVSLTATPAVGSVFDHWATDCTGSGACTLQMTQDRTVAATFTLRQMALTVRKGGNGIGTVTSTPVGLRCGITCATLGTTFDYGTSVRLRPARGLGSAFIGWSGYCSGRAPCVVPMTARRLVVAIFSTVCGRIAFVSTRGGSDDILTMNPDGTRVINVTRNPADDTDPAWSPDCSKIAFVSDRNGHPNIYVMNTDGTGVHRVTSGPADDTQPTWSPSGHLIAFTRTVGTNGDLWLVAPDGTHPRRLTSGAADDFRPDWSPNGRRIVFVSTRAASEQIFTMSPAGGSFVQVTHSRGQNLQPAWAPSGLRIAFVSTRDGNREIYIAKANGTGLIRLTRNPGIDAHPSWSPGGGRIAFYTTRTGNDEVFAINTNHTNAVNVSNNRSSDTGPVWTP